MRSSLSLFLLPILGIQAQQPAQHPIIAQIQRLWSQVTQQVGAVAFKAHVIPESLDSGASKLAAQAVWSLNASNWRDILVPGPLKPTGKPDEWLVYISGDNKTCYGGCVNATRAWNTSAAILSVSGPSLAELNCDQNPVLCSTLAVHPPAIYHLLLSSKYDPVARYIPLNQSSIKPSDIIELHTKHSYEQTKPYTGLFQPWTGLLAKSGLQVPVGWIMYGASWIPSWAPMIFFSFLSRRMIGQRRPAAPGVAAPAAAPAT